MDPRDGEGKEEISMATEIKLLGISDEVNNCECCGKANLKKTVVLDFDGGIRYYGSDCAALALMGKKSAANKKAVETKARAIGHARQLVANGYSLTVAARDVWNRFGFLTEVKANTIVIGGVGIVTF